MREHDEEDLPILDAVVRGGDEAIIRSLRLGRETLAELEALRRAALGPDEDDARLAADAGASQDASDAAVPARAGATVFLDPDTMRPRDTGDRPAAGTGVDVLLERQVDALRRELRELLGDAAARAGRSPVRTEATASK